MLPPPPRQRLKIDRHQQRYADHDRAKNAERKNRIKMALIEAERKRKAKHAAAVTITSENVPTAEMRRVVYDDGRVVVYSTLPTTPTGGIDF